MSRFGVFAVSGLVLGLLVAINVGVVANEGWNTGGIPHSYHYSALQHYYGVFHPERENGGFYFPSESDSDNRISALYAISDVLARIAEPTPAVFRLAATVLLLAVFAVAYFHADADATRLDRLLTAVMVTTTPVVFFLSRRLEDHLVHVLLLLIAATSLVRSDFGRRKILALPFYAVPAVGAMLTHMLTNYVVMMMSYAGMALYLLLVRRRDWRSAYHVAFEAALWVLAAELLYGAVLLRFDLSQLLRGFGYYESVGVEMGDGYSFSLAATLLGYPSVIVFSACGAVLSALAVANVRPAWRARHAGLYVLWIAVPLILLSVVQKKNTYYIWYTAPAVAFLAAGFLRRLAPRWKAVAVVFFLGTALLHWRGPVSPLEGWLNPAHFQRGKPFLLESIGYQPAGSLAKSAREILDAADRCAPPGGRAIAVLDSRWAAHEIYMGTLALSPRDRFWFRMEPGTLIPPEMMLVEPSDPEQRTKSRALLEPFVHEWYAEFIATHPVTAVVGRYQVRCGTTERGEVTLDR